MLPENRWITTSLLFSACTWLRNWAIHPAWILLIVFGLVLVAVGRFVDAEEFALGDFGLLAENLATDRLNGVMVSCFGHSYLLLNG